MYMYLWDSCSTIKLNYDLFFRVAEKQLFEADPHN